MLKNKKKGFTLVELIVVIAIMVVLLAVLAPSLLKYVENSRMQRDDSAMDEVCNSVQLAMADPETFDEVLSYSIPNNYVTYTDSSGVYGAKYTDEEFWAPDGSGQAVTITFNPDENGDYDIAKGMVNDMTLGNGSVADQRTAEGVKQCYLEEMGNQKLYAAVKKTIGTTLSEKSATYKNSSYTVFITFDLVDDMYRAEVYGEWNGTNLYEDSPASLGSGTSSYTPEGEAVVTKPTGGTTTPTFTNSDLSGGGSVANPDSDTSNTGNDNKTLVTFTVNNTEYQAEEGMTWTEWSASTYNTDGFYVGEHEAIVQGVLYNKNGNVVYEGSIGGIEVHATFTVPDKGEYFCYEGSRIPTGATYTKADGTVLSAGELFPETVTAGDSYVYGDYEYKYNYWYFTEANTWRANTSQKGWGVRVLDKTKAEYNPMLESVNEKNVTSIKYSFFGCTNLKTAPQIPSSVTDMSSAFINCTSLTTAPTIPDSVTNVEWAFEECTSLLIAPKMPNKIKSMQATFYGCTALTTAPIIPDSVTNLYNTFCGCKSLVTYTGSTASDGDFSGYVIPSGVTNMGYTFYNTKLTIAPQIPEGVTNMGSTFCGCTQLTTASAIPSSVTYMYMTFRNCSALTGTIEVKATAITNVHQCFYGATKTITLVGTGSNDDMLSKLASTSSYVIF